MMAVASTASAHAANIARAVVPAGPASAARRAPNDPVAHRREAVLPPIVSVWCVRVFAPAALAGAVIALVAPVAFVRVLGLVALGAGVAGVLLHAGLLRREHPAVWDGWFATHRARFARLRARWRTQSESSSPSLSRAGGPHGFARFAPLMAQEN